MMRVGIPFTRMLVAIHCTSAFGGMGISGQGSEAARAVPGSVRTASSAPIVTSSRVRRNNCGAVVFMMTVSVVAKVIRVTGIARIVKRVVYSAGRAEAAGLGHHLRLHTAKLWRWGVDQRFYKRCQHVFEQLEGGGLARH